MDSAIKTIVLQGKEITGSVPDLALMLKDEGFTLQAISDILDCSKNNISYHFIRIIGKQEKSEKSQKTSKRKKIIVSIEQRKNYLASVIFGKDYVIGENFDDFIFKILTLNKSLSKIIMDFYFRGTKDIPTGRVLRSSLTDRLASSISYDINKLLQDGVIVNE